jgi:hypothetical protein
MEMTKASLREICKATQLYGTPYLNDKLYLHYKVGGAMVSVAFS